MTRCKYWDSGFCYAPDYLKTNAVQGGCFEPEHCPTFRNSAPVQYETPMTKNEEEIEKVKAEIKVLEKKLSLLEEAEKTKTPCEEAYKRVYGNYPFTDIADTCWSGSTWTDFSTGYNAAQEDYKVGEHQEPKEEPKTLYQTLCDGGFNVWNCREICDIVIEWIYQYDCDYAKNDDYLEGYQKCQIVLEERLK